MKELLEIELEFENCEFFTIPRDSIGDFCVQNIHDVITRIGNNSIIKYQSADTVVMEIYKECDELYTAFKRSVTHITKLERLMLSNDISNITIKYTDGTSDKYEVNYISDRGMANIRQKTYMSKLGNVYIVIDDRPFEDWFDKNSINDENIVKMERECFSIGIQEKDMRTFNEDNLPEMYRYVYLFDDNHNDCLAMRVYDKDCDWKFIYEPNLDNNRIHCPTKWAYPPNDIVPALANGELTDASFSLGAILNKYPKEGWK